MAKKTKNKKLKTQAPVIESVMDKIESHEVKMMPKAYFWLGSVLLGIGAVGIFMLTSMLTSIWVFHVRMQRLADPELFNLMHRSMSWSMIPWLPLAMAFLSFVVGLLLIKKYDFAYKKNWWVIVLGILIGVSLMTGMIDGSGLNDRLSRDKRTKRFYGNIHENLRITPTQVRGRMHLR